MIIGLIISLVIDRTILIEKKVAISFLNCFYNK